MYLFVYKNNRHCICIGGKECLACFRIKHQLYLSTLSTFARSTVSSDTLSGVSVWSHLEVTRRSYFVAFGFMLSSSTYTVPPCRIVHTLWGAETTSAVTLYVLSNYPMPLISQIIDIRLYLQVLSNYLLPLIG